MNAFPADVISLGIGALGGFVVARLTLRRAVEERPRVAREERPEPAENVIEELLGKLPVSAIVLDGRGHVAFANRGAAELFGIDAQRSRGRALIEAIPSVDLERIATRALSGSRAEGVVVLRSQGTLPGEEATIAVSAIPSAERGVILIGEDRTRVAAMERVRRDFLADISHELRTPISSIRLMVETIELSGGDPVAIGMFLPKIVTELKRMTSLVEDLLDLARSESGQVQLNRTRVDVGKLAAESVDAFQPRAHTLDIELSIEAPEPLEAEVDPERFTQVVVNLVDNALRHTPANGHVRVRVEPSDGRAVLTVQDDGIGIPFKDLRHVFERFYVVERSRSRESSGTGLGLAIVKQIVEAHGGEIEVDSELGRGATFVCRLPLGASVMASHT